MEINGILGRERQRLELFTIPMTRTLVGNFSAFFIFYFLQGVPMGVSPLCYI